MAVEIALTTQAPPPPAVFLTELAFGMKMTQALYVAAKLGIADLLAAGPRPGGVERTRSEYHSLLADAGLRLDRIIPTQNHLSILEAVKA